MAVGAASTGTGGAIAKTSWTLINKASTAAVANVAIEMAKNKAIDEKTTKGKIVSAGVSGIAGQYMGKYLDDFINSFSNKGGRIIVGGRVTSKLDDVGNRITELETKEIISLYHFFDCSIRKEA